MTSLHALSDNSVQSAAAYCSPRGLKSLRTSPWDPKESLPADYARVFAFENFKRAHKRAKEAQQRATAEQDPCAVGMGGCGPEVAWEWLERGVKPFRPTFAECWTGAPAALCRP